MKIIDGGVCAAKGFKAGAIRCGIRKSQTKKDLAMILSDCECSAAAVYTTNRVKAAPILLTMENLSNGKARAVIVNSGNANACAPFGIENARREAMAAARALHVAMEDVVVASTGVIGQTLSVECIEEHAGSMEMKYGNSMAAAEAIMTTDTKVKTIAVEFEADGKTCHIGGICKGSGMIHPNMGTMLSFITTDCAISSEMLDKALKADVKKTFNRVTVDGDTSTNDMCCILANGMAGNLPVEQEGPDYDAYGDGRFGPQDSGRRRGSQQADDLYGIRRTGRGYSRAALQIYLFLIPCQGRNLWFRRQLGPRALCNGLFRRSIQYGRGDSGICL